MSKLHDPNLPAGAIVATHEEDESLEEGQVRRNDGVVLNPASKNPWYVLATVAGEQGSKIDWDLHEKNRRFWNGWMCQGMSPEDRASLAEKLDLDVEEFKPLTPDEKRKLDKRFANAFRDVAEDELLPDPSKAIDMSKTHFPSTLVLRKCHFAKPADFETAHFVGFADFASAHFAELTDFQTAHFAGPAFFQTAHFVEAAYFQTAYFAQRTNFRTAHFARHTDFRTAYFAGPAYFSNGAFKAKTDFTGTKFETLVPEFFRCELHQNTRFSDDPKFWPTVTEDNAEDGRQSYTRLRQIAAEIYDPDLEHFFLRQEMRCKEVIEWSKGAWFHALLFAAYRLIADSGISVARPLAVLTGVIALGWWIIGSWLRHGTPSDGVSSLSDAPIQEGLGISIGNTLPFLGLVRKMHPDFYKEAPAWLDAISGVQSVAGIALLFFLGLGLRNRFRL